MLVQLQHGLADLRKRGHQLAHPARLEEHVLQPLAVDVGDEGRDFHGSDGDVAVQQERGRLQDREVCDEYLGHVGAFEVSGVGGVLGVGFCERGDEGVEDVCDVVEDFFDLFGAYFGLAAAPVVC